MASSAGWGWPSTRPSSAIGPGITRLILRGLDEFREHLGGELTIMLLRAIGVPFDAHEIDKGVMLGSVEVLRSLEEARRSPRRAAEKRRAF